MSFDRAYEAEIRRELLQNADIPAVVINAQDSMFMFGNVDIYVKAEDAKKALNILSEIQGLTKINSFVMKKPIELFQSVLNQHNITSQLKEKSNDKYILDNYELYVENSLVEQVLPLIKSENIDGWQKIDTCQKVRQTSYKVQLLEGYGIDAMTIKKKDSQYHLEEIFIFVERDNADKASKILRDLEGWTCLKTYLKQEVAELKEDILARNKVKAIIRKEGEEFKLFVEEANVRKAEEIIQNTQEWVEIQAFETILEAERISLLLEGNSIEAGVLAKQDSMFLLGGYAVYVEKRKANEAIEIIRNADGGKITE